jgi:virginiamycin B lyase
MGAGDDGSGRAGRRVAAPLLAAALTMSLTMSLAGCTGLAPPNPVIVRGPAPAPTTTIPAAAFAVGDPFLARLRAGGFVLVMRHAQTTPALRGEGRARPLDPGDCATQPVLSAAGRAQARTVGTAIGRLAVPVRTVLASPWCATRDTAFAAFGRVQGAGDLDQPLGGLAAQAAKRLRALAGTAPAPGTNTVLVTFAATVAAAFRVTPAEGETLVVRPGGPTGPQVVRRVPAGAWMALAGPAAPAMAAAAPKLASYRVGGHKPADVAPARGLVWWVAPASGQAGSLDPASGAVHPVRLGVGAAPQAVVVGPDGAPWVADAGRNALERIDPRTRAVRTWPLPAGRPAVGLCSVAFDPDGTLWFTGRRGVIGRLLPASGSIEVFDTPAGAEPDALTVTARGEVFYVAPRAGHLARVDPETGTSDVLAPPTPGPLGRAAADAGGRVWVTEPASSQVAVFDPASGGWREWRLPAPPGTGVAARPADLWAQPDGPLWLADSAAGVLTSFDPRTERFRTVAMPFGPAARLAGRGGEVWAAAPGAGRLVVARG